VFHVKDVAPLTERVAVSPEHMLGLFTFNEMPLPIVTETGAVVKQLPFDPETITVASETGMIV
jgi:hypothetical protein